MADDPLDVLTTRMGGQGSRGQAAPSAEPEQDDALARLSRRMASPRTSPESPPVSRDPWARMISALAERLPEGTPASMRAAGRFVIPQTSVEAALMALTLPVGGPVESLAAKFGMPWLARAVAALSRPGVRPALQRIALLSAATGGVGALTGHDPRLAALEGTVGTSLGEMGQAGVQALGKNAAVKRMGEAVTRRLSRAVHTVLGRRWLPEVAKPEQVLADTLAGGPAQRIGQAMNQWVAEHAQAELPASLLKAAQKAGLEGSLFPGPSGGIKFGPLWKGLERAMRSKDEAQHAAALAFREQLIGALGSGVEARDLLEWRALQRDYGVAVTLREFLAGGRSPKAAEDAVAQLTDEESGRVSLPGWQRLQARLAANRPQLEARLGANAMAALMDALYWAPEQGLARIQEGTPLWRRGIGGMSVRAGAPHLWQHLDLPRAASAPGWEAEARRGVRLLSEGLPPMVAPVPAKLAGD